MTNQTTNNLSLTEDNIRDWITSKISGMTNLNESEINPYEPFANFGIDSMLVITFVGDLEDWLQIKIHATLLWDYPNIHAVTKYLTQRLYASND